MQYSFYFSVNILLEQDNLQLLKIAFYRQNNSIYALLGQNWLFWCLILLDVLHFNTQNYLHLLLQLSKYSMRWVHSVPKFLDERQKQILKPEDTSILYITSQILVLFTLNKKNIFKYF